MINVEMVRNVMNHLSHHFNLFEATHFVLSGTSAGGFGVRLTFDDGDGVLTLRSVGNR